MEVGQLRGGHAGGTGVRDADCSALPSLCPASGCGDQHVSPVALLCCSACPGTPRLPCLGPCSPHVGRVKRQPLLLTRWGGMRAEAGGGEGSTSYA